MISKLRRHAQPGRRLSDFRPQVLEMPLVLHVVGTRPNFVKLAPLMRALDAQGADQRLVHTGQHYDPALSDIFFQDLALPAPDAHLNIGPGSRSTQTAQVMLGLEHVLPSLGRPDFVVVIGDVTSTLAAALAAAQLGLRVAHLEAGLRSGDRTMPEEVNRVAVDHLADLLLTPSPDADQNLRREGVVPEQFVRVGNCLIDSLLEALPRIRERAVPEQLGLDPGRYALVTLHRPSNVDDARALRRIIGALTQLTRELPVVFPVHPRTRARLRTEALPLDALHLTTPLGYLDFISLLAGAQLVLTDSGGLQEETTALDIPCLTLRENTERPMTILDGTNQLVGTDPDRILAGASRAIAGGFGHNGPALWDGHAAPRAAEAILARCHP